MRRIAFHLVLAGMLGTSVAVFQAQQSAAAPATAANAEMTTYYAVFLRRGPAWTAAATPESQALSRGHQENIQRLTAAGTMVVAGPFLEQSGSQALAGLFILRVASMEQARAAVESDPAVKGGRFTYEIVPWAGPRTLRY